MLWATSTLLLQPSSFIITTIILTNTIIIALIITTTIVVADMIVTTVTSTISSRCQMSRPVAGYGFDVFPGKFIPSSLKVPKNSSLSKI